ncbi:hypothetical protein J6590_063994 [Homalodisca vitripennis]|nr:hypothetical protein J6590_063994 [Homalodisca vitripennis]
MSDVKVKNLKGLSVLKNKALQRSPPKLLYAAQLQLRELNLIGQKCHLRRLRGYFTASSSGRQW